jgi:hypothetical protein
MRQHSQAPQFHFVSFLTRSNRAPEHSACKVASKLPVAEHAQQAVRAVRGVLCRFSAISIVAAFQAKFIFHVLLVQPVLIFNLSDDRL